MVEWSRVGEFTVGEEERPGTSDRNAARGPRAVRTPVGEGRGRVFVPCAYLAPHGLPLPEGVAGPRLFLDPEGERLLTFLEPPEDVDGERHFRVRDADGGPVGTIRRVPPSMRLLHHTWRIDQPGRPVVEGRNEWAATAKGPDAARKLARRALARGVGVAMSGDEGAYGFPPRKLEWVADGQRVMVSQGQQSAAIEADWLDRRLAFTAVLLEHRFTPRKKRV
ncbi:hypothetical protein GCM10009716_12110 [Streptomyces sodiiphilus]|uniref:Uncharacterized protein n=1 Tax=Streptomyces sodiiphilus TaxID=226217 RepID=A0ABP5A5V2_9ACTN